MRVDTTSLISGALVCGDRGLGVLGSAILSGTATGDHGAGYLYNDVDSGDEVKEFRGVIVTPPSAGEFFAYEDGSFSLIAPDGSYTFVYRLYVDGVDLGTATASLTIGGAVSSASFAVSTADSAFAGWAAVNPRASFTLTADGGVFVGAATVSPFAAFSVAADSSVFAGAASVGTAASIAVATDPCVFAGAATVSPIAALAVTCGDSVFAGSASGVTGAAIWPLASQVLAGVVYGPTGADYTGTLTGGSGPSAAEIAAAVLGSLQSTFIPVDLRKVRGQTINGTGSGADPWGPS